MRWRASRPRGPAAARARPRVGVGLTGGGGRLARPPGRTPDAKGAVCAPATAPSLPLPPDRAEEVLRHLYLEGDDRPVTREDL